MNIVVRELRTGLKSILTWCGIFTVLVIVYMTEFSAYANNEEMLAILDGIPEQLLEAFKMNSFNLTTLTGFYGILFTYFALMLSIQAILKGNSIIVKEERDKTVEFALVMPVKRSKIITAKIIASLVNCLVIIGFLYALILITAQKYLPEEGFLEFIWLLVLSTFILQLLFLSIGIMLGCTTKRHKISGYIGLSLIIGTYLMSIISDLSDTFEFFKYITPFKYFDTLLIKNNMELDLMYVLISATIIIVSLLAGYISYKRRDLYI
ncbi:MAG: ABC transporter permease subunit [Clostridia bacterium]|nr:ABC transporter permease subunit [Clostridia bacterium]